MIVYKIWREYYNGEWKDTKHWYEGWFLFGFIPLYIKRHSA